MALILLGLLVLIPVGIVLLSRLLVPPHKYKKFRRRRKLQKTAPSTLLACNLPWATEEILQLWVSLKVPTTRYVVSLFNRRHARARITTSFEHVSSVVKANQKRIDQMRGAARAGPPPHIPWQLMWSADVTFRRDENGEEHAIFCILEIYSRACLVLRELQHVTAISIIRCVLDAVEQFGRPSLLRTDNEAQFRSRLFRGVLWCLGIKHDRIDPYAARQNARVERFFRTLKYYLRRFPAAMEALPKSLLTFRFWYNHVRPHSNLFGRTPVEAWMGYDIFAAGPKEELVLEDWNGHLAGIYFKPIASLDPELSRPTSRHFQLWTKQEEKTIRDHRHEGLPALSELLPGRTPASIKCRLQTLRLSRVGSGLLTYGKWSSSEVATLRSVYPRGTKAEIIRALPNHPYYGILRKASKMKLRCEVTRGRHGGGEPAVSALPQEAPHTLNRSFTVGAAQAFIELVERSVGLADLQLSLRESRGRPTLTIAYRNSRLDAAIGHVRSKARTGRRSSTLRAIARPMIRINRGKVRVSAFSVLGAGMGDMTVEDWRHALKSRVLPLFEALEGDQTVAECGPSRVSPKGSRVADRRRLGFEDASKVEILAGRIRAAARSEKGAHRGKRFKAIGGVSQVLPA